MRHVGGVLPGNSFGISDRPPCMSLLTKLALGAAGVALVWQVLPAVTATELVTAADEPEAQTELGNIDMPLSTSAALAPA